MVTLYLVRHTETTVPKGICYGQSDVEPDMERLDARLLEIRPALGDTRFSCCYTSPSVRCRLLAEGLVKESGRIRDDCRLMEMNFGRWELQPWLAIHPEAEAMDWYTGFWQISCPEGESLQDMAMRVKSFVNEIFQLADGFTVLVITHAGWIQSCTGLLNRTNPVTWFNNPVPFGAIRKVIVQQPI
jgi:alpha-ribazole phosphatase